MNINVEVLLQLVTYLFMVIGGLAFVVSIVTQGLKEQPFFKKFQTNVVALTISMILCPITVVAVCQYFNIVIVWYYVFASFIAAFIVYLVSTGGWEKITEMWNRTKYQKK